MVRTARFLLTPGAHVQRGLRSQSNSCVKKTTYIYWSTQLRLYHKLFDLAIPMVSQFVSKTENINKARRQFFALGSLGGFLGHSNPLSAREVVETCVIPTLLYGAENWILDEGCLERFHTEMGRRILKLTRSSLAVQIGLSLTSVTSRILKLKLSYLCHLLSSEDKSIATTTSKSSLVRTSTTCRSLSSAYFLILSSRPTALHKS